MNVRRTHWILGTVLALGVSLTVSGTAAAGGHGGDGQGGHFRAGAPGAGDA